MVELPQDLVEIIMDYKNGLEHVLKFRACLVELFFLGMIHRPFWVSLQSVTYWLPF